MPAPMHVYRRPVDFRGQAAQWLLLRPDLNVTATSQALAIAIQAATVVKGAGVMGVSASLAITPNTAGISSGLSVVATAAELISAGQQSSASYLDTTAFVFRDVPSLIPVGTPGIYRRSFTLRPSRPSVVIPRVVTTGSVDANRADLAFSPQAAEVHFEEAVRVWLLHEALRAALQRRQIAYREPLDMRPWSERTVQFTLPSTNLTAYTRDLTLTGQQSTVLVSRGVAAQFAQLAITKPTAAVRLGKAISAQSATLALSPQASRVGTGRTVSAALEEMAMDGQSAQGQLGKAVQATSQALLISGLQASFGANLTIAAQVRVMAVTPNASSARVEKAVAAFTAELALTASPATTSVSAGIPASTASLQIDAGNASVQFARQVEAAFASLSIDDRQALIEGTQAVIVQVGRRTIRVRARNSTITVH